MKITYNKFKIKDLSGKGVSDKLTKFLTLEEALKYFKFAIEDDLEDSDEEYEENNSLKSFIETCYSRICIAESFNENPTYKIICMAYSHDDTNESVVKSFNEFKNSINENLDLDKFRRVNDKKSIYSIKCVINDYMKNEYFYIINLMYKETNNGDTLYLSSSLTNKNKTAFSITNMQAENPFTKENFEVCFTNTEDFESLIDNLTKAKNKKNAFNEIWKTFFMFDEDFVNFEMEVIKFINKSVYNFVELIY